MKPEAVKAYEAAPLALAQQERPSADLAKSLAESLRVETHADYEAAGEIARALLTERDRLDGIRKGWTGPLTDVVRSINGAFKPPLEALETAAATVKGKLAAFAERMAEERARAVTVDPGTSAIPFTPEAPGVSVRTRRTFEIVDPDRVPRQFCSPDEGKIKAHLRDGGLEAIPGVRFFDAPIVSVRRNG